MAFLNKVAETINLPYSIIIVWIGGIHSFNNFIGTINNHEEIKKKRRCISFIQINKV